MGQDNGRGKDLPVRPTSLTARLNSCLSNTHELYGKHQVGLGGRPRLPALGKMQGRVLLLCVFGPEWNALHSWSHFMLTTVGAPFYRFLKTGAQRALGPWSNCEKHREEVRTLSCIALNHLLSYLPIRRKALSTIITNAVTFNLVLPLLKMYPRGALGYMQNNTCTSWRTAALFVTMLEHRLL